MKTVKYKVSSIVTGDRYTYFVNISDKHPTWYYTYEATQEGFGHFLSICQLAGYEIIEQPLS